MPVFRSNPALLCAFRRGDRAALEHVYWTYIDRVELVARHGFHVLTRGQSSAPRVLGARHDELADLVQETFARAFAARTRQSYDGQREYGPFLITITRNLLVDRARNAGRELAAEDLDTQLENEASVEEPFADDKTMCAVQQYLHTLPADLRAVHEQRYVLGVSQRDAAQALSLSRQSVRTLEKRLRSGLQAYLDQLGLSIEQSESTHLTAGSYEQTSSQR